MQPMETQKVKQIQSPTSQHQLTWSIQKMFKFLRTKIGRGVVSTLSSTLIVLSGVLLWSDNILLSLYPDFALKPLGNFSTAHTGIWTLSISITPIIVIVCSFLRPHIISYLSPLFGYLVLVVSTVLGILGYEIESMNTFRGIIFLLSAIILFTIQVLKRYADALFSFDRTKERILKTLHRED